MKTKNYDIVIIGAGAAGLAAGISAKRKLPDSSVLFIEKNDRVGKKILSTGNGKCNLLNTDNKTENNYYSDNMSFVMDVMKRYDYESNRRFFSSLSLIMKTDSEGRVYPYSAHSATVLDALRKECDKLQIHAVFNAEIKNVSNKKNCFEIELSDLSRIICRSIIVSTGGKSYRNDNCLSGYEILQSFSHKCTPLSPALVPLKVQNPVKSLKGIRAPAVATLFVDGKKVKEESGEIQFTEYGISGIAVMQLSIAASKALLENKKCRISLDLMQDYSVEDIREIIITNIQRDENLETQQLLNGIFHKMLSNAIIKESLKADAPLRAGELSCKDVEDLAKTVKNFEFRIIGTTGFQNAQVTAGGIALDGFSSKTLESKYAPGLFAAGEVLDVTGVCGGFNLGWAWSSGRLAGLSAAEGIAKNAENQ